MSQTRFPAFRRLVTTLLLLSFTSYGVEAAVADVHDRDSGPAQLTSDHGLSTSDHSVPGPSQSNRSGDSHPFHVCHCSHTHAGVLPIMPELTPMIVPMGQLSWFGVSLLPSIQRAPPLRPPIV